MEKQRYKVIIAEENIDQTLFLNRHMLEMNLIVANSVSSGIRLIEEVQIHRPDIIVLDINLKKLDGISAIREIHNEGFFPQIIFVTSSLDPEHLLAGFELNTIDYITKPVNAIRLTKAINKAKEQIHAKKLLDAEMEDPIHWVVLKQNYRDVTVAVNQVIYVEKDKVQRNKYLVHLKDGTTLETSTHLKEIKGMCSDSLVYSHRSYLVNIHYIVAIQPDGLIARNYNVSLSHTSNQIPLTKKFYLEAGDIFSKYKAHLT